MAVEQEYQGARGSNYFDEDKLVQNILRDIVPKNEQEKLFRELSEFGSLVGGKIADLIETSHQDGKYPVLRKYDRWGKRIDVIDYCPEQIEARRLALEAGVLPPTPLIERMTKAYLLNQNGEGGITCPLAMTDGLVVLLEGRGTPEQNKRYGKLLHDPKSDTPLTAGQYVTEKQGGSNVSENETEAVEQKDGTWRLTGTKWFCSNPGDLWVTTAKPKGSKIIALFLVPRHLPDGTLNDCHILRLKDLSGTRGKATAEIEYKEAYAEIIGRPLQGLAILLGTVLKASRIHVAAASAGFMRRAYVEAKLFCEQRIVLGKPAAELPHVQKTLKNMAGVLTTSTKAFYTMLRLLEAGDPAADVLVPLLKSRLSETGSWMVHNARLLMAGNATVRDFSILPRLAEDAIIQEIWEGTHPVLAGHTMRALSKKNSREAFLQLLPVEMISPISAAIDEVSALVPEEKQAKAGDLCTAVYTAFTSGLSRVPGEKVPAGS